MSPCATLQINTLCSLCFARRLPTHMNELGMFHEPSMTELASFKTSIDLKIFERTIMSHSIFVIPNTFRLPPTPKGQDNWPPLAAIVAIKVKLDRSILTNISGFDGHSVINTISSHTNDMPVTFQSGYNATFV